MGIVALIFGIVSIVMCFFPALYWLGVLLGVLGIVFAAIGMSKAKKTNSGKGVAVAGLVLSIIGTVLCGIFWIACAATIAALS